MMRDIFLLLIGAASIFGCTSFQVKAQDGSVVYCRSMEFGFPMQSEIVIVPRGAAYVGTAPENHPGLSWKVVYGFLGMNQSAAPQLVNDGMNEKGLVVGCLYLPGYAKYETVKPSQYEKTLGAWELPSYLLSICATVEEVKSALARLFVAEQGTPQLNGFILPIHFHVCDASGKSLVIEFINGERRIYDNPIGVLTNSPPFDWQMTHLMGYVNLSPSNVPSLQLKNYKVPFFGQGSGLLGLPGDFTPPSRFVRAALFSSFAGSPRNALQAVRLGFHILNTFDIFEGIIRPSAKEEKTPEGFPHSDITQWIVVHDQTNKKTYFRSYESLAIQRVDLKMVDFTEGGLRQISMRKELFFEDVTENSRSLMIK